MTGVELVYPSAIGLGHVVFRGLGLRIELSAADRVPLSGSTNPNAILTVFSSSGSPLFDLTNQGGGRYAEQRGFVFNPVTISVRSNFGGSASARLQSYRWCRDGDDARQPPVATGRDESVIQPLQLPG